MPFQNRILLDTPAEGTLAMGFDEVSDAFADIILGSDPRFAIGLFGSWGSGKTTLMRAIRRKLDIKSPNANAIVWFAAWRYEKEAHLIIPLLDTIREAVLAWGQKKKTEGAKERAIALAKTIGDVTVSLLSGLSMKLGVPGLAQFSFDANKAIDRAEGYDGLAAEAATSRSSYHASFNALRDAFAAFQKDGAERIVIFVDDLDRCLPEGALEVLESTKLFFDLSGFVFVVGLDAQVVERFVEHRYRELRAGDDDKPPLSGQAYLRKIFQVPFGLRPVVGSQIDAFLEASMPVPEPPATDDLPQIIRPFLAKLVTEQGFNPRELKRFINAFTIQRLIRDARRANTGQANFFDDLAAQEEARIILALQVIAFRSDWANVEVALLAFGDAIMAELLAYVQKPEPSRDASVFTPYVGAVLPASFLAFLEDADTGKALMDFAQTGRQIGDFLYEGASLVTTTGFGSAYVPALQAIGGRINMLDDVLNKANVGQMLERMSQAAETITEILEDQGLRAYSAQLDALERDVREFVDTTNSAMSAEVDPNLARERAVEAIKGKQSSVRAELQSIMQELSREYRVRG